MVFVQVLVLVSMSLVGCDIPTDPTELEALNMMDSRLKMACPVQLTDVIAKKYYKCLEDKGLDYKMLTMTCPCKDLAGEDTCTVAGAWAATCKPGNKMTMPDGIDIKRCFLKEMKKQTNGKDIIEVSKKSGELVAECNKNVGGSSVAPTKKPPTKKPPTKKPTTTKKPRGPSPAEMGAMRAISRAG